MRFTMQYIPPGVKTLHMSRRVAGKISSTLNLMKRDGLKLFNLTTRTWNDRPQFLCDIAYKGFNIELSFYPDNSAAGNHWIALNNGFERKVRLSRDWRSKTWPGKLVASPGQGTVVGRLDNPARVAARDWISIINGMMAKSLVANINRAIREGVS